MLVERAITAYLKRKYSRILQLTDFDHLTPPRPQPGKEYLIYIHVPFCEELCPYCSFNRVVLDRELAAEYFRALRQEIRMYTDRGFTFSAAYVGGGTPTVMPDEITALLADLKRAGTVREISLETNPNHLTDDILGTLKEAGVNRLSVGVQSFEDSLLTRMKRFHKYGSGEQIRKRLEKCAGVFDTLNVDMIFNFPTQTMEMLDRDLDVITGIRADQATFYPLMVSDVTKKQLASTFGPISYRKEKLFYHRILERLGDDYTPGTAWCFSRKRSMIDEYIVDYDEYVGVGSGAFGYVGGSVLTDTFSVSHYIERVRAGRFPLQAKRDFSDKDRIQYDFLMKLFGTTIDIAAAEAKFNGRFLKNLKKEIRFFQLAGAVVSDNGRLRLTRKGQYLWVVMMREFFTGVNNFRATCLDLIKGDAVRDDLIADSRRVVDG